MNSMVGKITKNHVRLVLFNELLQTDITEDVREKYLDFYADKLAKKRRCISADSKHDWDIFKLFVRWGSFKKEGRMVLQQRSGRWVKTWNTQLTLQEEAEVKNAVITIPCEWRLSQ